MTLLLLLACSSGPSTDIAAAAFGSPAEAEDLDPAGDVVHVALVAAPLEVEVAAAKNGDHDEETTTTVAGYAYNGQVPGPTVRAKVGDTVVVELTNNLDVATTIHWHGLTVPNDMDGVTWLADPVEPGETFTYTFPVSNAGTFWYHPHLDIANQVENGLYGAFVVEDPAEPKAERELVVVWQASAGGTTSHDDGVEDDAHGADTGHTGEADAKSGDHDHSAHGVSDPAALAWTANGVSVPTYTWGQGERVRVRMVNAALQGYLDLRWPDLRHIGGDQGLLAAEAAPASLVLAPGDRAEVEWRGEGFTVETALHGADGGAALGASVPLLVAQGRGDADAVAWPFSGALPSADPGGTDVTYVLSGGGDGTWMINGETWPDVTVHTIAAATDAVLEVRNLSPSEHPFHVHGHRFEVLSVDGVAPAVRTVEDTLNVAILSRVRLKLLAPTSGDWMVHCHLVEHEENGMMTVLRVE